MCRTIRIDFCADFDAAPAPRSATGAVKEIFSGNHFRVLPKVGMPMLMDGISDRVVRYCQPATLRQAFFLTLDAEMAYRAPYNAMYYLLIESRSLDLAFLPSETYAHSQADLAQREYCFCCQRAGQFAKNCQGGRERKKISETHPLARVAELGRVGGTPRHIFRTRPGVFCTRVC